jgi:hypothetical protein
MTRNATYILIIHIASSFGDIMGYLMVIYK